MPKGKINILDQRPQFAQNSASGAHLIGSVQEPVLKVSVRFTLGMENEERVVVVSHIQRIGCQPEKNYFIRWPIPLVVC